MKSTAGVHHGILQIFRTVNFQNKLAVHTKYTLLNTFEKKTRVEGHVVTLTVSGFLFLRWNNLQSMDQSLFLYKYLQSAALQFGSCYLFL